MPFKTPSRAPYATEFAPGVPKKEDVITRAIKKMKKKKLLKYNEWTVKAREEQKQRRINREKNPKKLLSTKERKDKGKRKAKKKRLPTFPMTKPQYWDFQQKPKWKNLRKKKPVRIPKLRASITFGTVLIILTGRHRGKRCVFLKQLDRSGTLMCCGPKRCNRIKLIRIPQAYVIATKTKINLDKVYIKHTFKGKKQVETLDERIKHIKDSWFVKAKTFRKKKQWKRMRKDPMYLKPRSERPDNYKFPKALLLAQMAKEINKAVYWRLRKGDRYNLLQQYMSSKFRLKRKDKPHDMVF